jgi:aminopeptidase N
VPKFARTAMENWGLIIHSEDTLLLKSDLLEDKQLISMVIAHEISHQWVMNGVSNNGLYCNFK